MFRVKIDSSNLNKILKNTVDYSTGYIYSIEETKTMFYKELAECVIDTLNKYIDSQARIDPQKLHHVYEWNMLGEENGRLFEFKSTLNKNGIRIDGKFLPSKTISNSADEPFTNKAYVMENSIAIEISPKNSDVLVFESGDQTVFTTNSIYVEHPGGPHVENGFGDTIDNFFNTYFTHAVLQPILDKLAVQIEYDKSFSAGTKIGRSVGVKAGREYLLSTVRMKIE